MAKEIEYLGHTLSADGIKLKNDLLAAIKMVAAPQDKGQLRSFLGLIEYFSKFVKHFASKMKYLKNLLRKCVNFTLCAPQKICFENIKKELCEAGTSVPFDTRSKSVVKVDAKASGIGVFLSQFQGPQRKLWHLHHAP